MNAREQNARPSSTQRRRRRTLAYAAAGLGVVMVGATVVGCCRVLNGNDYPKVPVAVSEGPHPCVALTVAELEDVRRRSVEQDWARAVRERILAQAAKLAAEPLDIPHAGGQYTHYYTCADDGARLRPESPTRHVCPVCGAVYTGYPYNDVYVSLRHNHWLNAVEDLGQAYALDPAPAYAQRVRDILVEYASFYLDLPLHDKHGRSWVPLSGRARLFAQTLDEAVVLCGITMGYDLVYEAPSFSAEDHRAIEEGLLRPMVRTIQANPRAVNNWQSWHNAAVGCVGFLLGDEKLVDWAVNGWFGFGFQMRHSVLPSGMWYEGAPSYHWYALRAHLFLLEAAARAGMDLYGPAIVKRLFDAPLRQLLPDGTFVPFNDSDRQSIGGQRAFYEVACARYREPLYAALLEPRDTEWGLFWGAEELPPGTGEELRLESSNDLDEGLAVLRDVAGGIAVFLDYGKGYSGHVHPARLNFVLYAHDDVRLVDPGRLAYGNPMHEGWYRQTVAHNTVVVNERSQWPSAGELAVFEANDAFALVRARAKRAYLGVTLDRTVCLCANAVVDVVQCRALGRRTFDLPLHFRGGLAGLPSEEPLERLSDAAGYREVQEPAYATAPMAGFAVNVEGGRSIAVDIRDDSEVFLGQGYGTASMTELLPMVLRRQHGNEALFVTVFQILEPGAAAVPVDTEIAEDICVSLGDNVELHVGERATVVVIDGEEHLVGSAG